MAEHVDTGGTSLRDAAREMRREMSRENIETRLDEFASERPAVQYLLSWDVVVRAVLIAAVITLIFLLLTSPPVAGFVLVLSFFASWFGLAARRYDERRPTKPADSDER